ncbi:hypothetical protein GCM10009118_10360 [Wandonia haliotis]|uniref:Secretion system C-terminal sorting domain-containing protein n=1 Tax=Wandonia haliotis TaxID=574963 RepID=A0ABN1MMX9_9FLAO
MKKVYLSLVGSLLTFVSFEQTVFVDIDATGNNDGTSWTNAYTTLQQAEDNAPSGAEIWVAEGNYIGDPLNRAQRILRINESHNWYGGFNGTETTKDQRNPLLHETSINGDALGNGHATAADVTDNTYNLVLITTEAEVLFDGFTFKESHGNGTSGNDRGGVFQFDANAFGGHMAPQLDLENCKFEYNYANNQALFSALEAPARQAIYEIRFNRCHFNENRGFYDFISISALSTPTGYNTKQAKFTNCLFANNTANSGYFLQVNYNTANDARIEFINNTIIGNTSNSYLFLLSDNYNNASSGSFLLKNNIIVDNPGVQFLTTGLGDLNGSNNVGQGTAYGANNELPATLFNDYANQDYHLVSGSPAIGVADVAFLASSYTLDLAGQPRFIGQLDAGAYEFVNCELGPLEVTANGIGELEVTWQNYSFIDNNYTVTIVPTGQPVGNGTPITGITGNNYLFTGLLTDETYDIYVDYSCASFGGTTGSSMITGTTINPVFVDLDATGSNDGSSWANAYTNLEDAVTLSPVGSEFWVAEGVYRHPVSGNRNLAALQIHGNSKFYGGFDGTESNRTARNPKQNETQISGDVNGDDIPGDYTTNRGDNLYRTVLIINSQSDFVLDGFTISGGHANETSDQKFSRGGAVQVWMTLNNQTIKGSVSNCVIKDNYADVSSLYYVFPSSGTGSGHSVQVDFTSCEIIENGAPNTLVYFRSDLNYVEQSSILNSLIANHTTQTELFLFNTSNVSKLKAKLINNTIVKNTASNQIFRLINADNCGIYNNILYNENVNAASDVLSMTHGSVLSANNFGKTTAFGATVLNANSFVDYASDNFRLNASSNAVDGGQNTYFPASISKDLEGIERIYNTVIDAGAYEYQIIPDLTSPVPVTQNITVYLNASGTITVTPQQVDNGSNDNQTASNDLTLSLDQTSFDCSNLGNNTVTLTVTDESNNSATATATITVVDNLPPTAHVNNLTVTLDASGNATITTAQIDNGSTDNCGIASMTLGTTSFDCSNIGTNTVSFTVFDQTGNNATAYATVTVEENEAPVAQAQDLTISLDANGQASITPAQIDNGSTDNCGITDYTLDITDFTCADLGNNTVTLTVEDGSGNTHTATATVTVFDNFAPVLTAQDATLELDANGQVTVSLTDLNAQVSDNCSVSPITMDVSTFDCSHLGAQTINLEVTDTDGNTTTESVTVTIVDNQAPVVNINNLTVTLDASGNATITTAQIDNGSTDNCGIASMNLGTTSFDCSNIGINTVSFTVFDQEGNNATAYTTVTVVENEAPIAQAQDLTVSLDANGQASITPAQIDNGSTDNCGITGYTLDITDFTCADLGANTVTLTVEDGSGNTHSATAVVTLVDDISPALTAQNTTIELDANGQATVSLTDLNAQATDNCSLEPITMDISTFDCSHLGTQTINLEVEDMAGNTTTTSVQVVIADYMAPTGTSQDISISLDGASSVTIDWTDLISNVQDNCDSNPVVTISQDEFTATGVYTVTITLEDANGNNTTETVQVTVTDTTNAVDEYSIEFNIYPNPTTGFVQITSTQSIQQIYVYSVSGELLLSTQNTSVDLSSFERGTYLLQIETETSNFTRRIIKL